MCAAPTVVAAILAAPRPAAAGTGRSPAADRPHRGRRRAAAVQDDRAGRGRARLGVHPDLRPDRDLADVTMNRTRAEWDELPSAERARRLGPRRGAGPRRADSTSTPRARSWPPPTTSSTATGSSPTETAEALGAAGSTPATGATRDGLPGHLRPQEGRHHHRRRERVAPSRSRTSPTSTRRSRGGRHRHPGREVGRDRLGLGRPQGGHLGDRDRPHRALPVPHGPLQGAPGPSRSARCWPGPPPGSSQKYKLRQPYWEGRERQVN